MLFLGSTTRRKGTLYQLLPHLQTTVVRSLSLYFKSVRVASVAADKLTNGSFRQRLLFHQHPEERVAVIRLINLTSALLNKTLPVMEKTEQVSVDPVLTNSSDFLIGDNQDSKSTCMMELVTVGCHQDALVNQSSFQSDNESVNQELPPGESKSLIPAGIDLRSSNEVTSGKMKDGGQVTNKSSGESSSANYPEVSCSFTDSSFDEKDDYSTGDNESLGLGTLFGDSLQCTDENRRVGQDKQGPEKSKKGGFCNTGQLCEDESFGLENLFDENLQSKDAARWTIPQIKLTSKQKKRERRKRKRKLSGFSDEDDTDTSSTSVSKADTASSKPQKKPKRIVPNYFVAIRVSNPDIHSAVKIVQDSIATHDEKLKPALIPLVTLHLTLLVVYLKDKEEVQKAAEILDQCRTSLEPLLQNSGLALTFSGLDHFQHQVLFVKIGEEEELEALNSVANIVRETFAKEGIPSTDSRDFKPHLTVVKLSRSPKLRKKGIKKIPVESYTSWVDFKFGEDPVNALHLCSMNAKDKDGFYKSVASLTFLSGGGLGSSSKDIINTLRSINDETVREHEESTSSLSSDTVSHFVEDSSEAGGYRNSMGNASKDFEGSAGDDKDNIE